jgi:hypothetical protein
MKPEKCRLIDELLDGPDGGRRAATLLAGRRILRYKRWRRRASQGLGFALVVTIVAIWPHSRTAPQPRAAATRSTATPAVRFLTDDQLLALFPNIPVGLAIVDGRKVLIFPRPGDAEKFIGKF